MSAPEPRESEVLLAAFANRELSPESESRMRELAATDPDLAGQVEEVEAVHALLAEEQALHKEVIAGPASRPDEAADPVFRRLAGAAAQSSDEIRARYASGVVEANRARSAERWRAIGIAIGIAAVLVFGISYFFGEDRPGLNSGAPDDSTLGGARLIELDGTLELAAPTWRWPEEAGAVGYEATLKRVDGAVAMQRAVGLAASNVWKLDGDQLVFVRREVRSRLWLRVEAVDAEGERIAWGEVEVELVE